MSASYVLDFLIRSGIKPDMKVGLLWIPTRLCRKSDHPFKFPIQKGKYDRYVIIFNKFSAKSDEEFELYRDIWAHGKLSPEYDNLADLVEINEKYFEELPDYDVEGIAVYRLDPKKREF